MGVCRIYRENNHGDGCMKIKHNLPRLIILKNLYSFDIMTMFII